MAEHKVAKRLVLTGLVQGIGFRPHVYKLAGQAGVRGSVKNSGGAVEILCEGSERQVQNFLFLLQNETIPYEQITEMRAEDVPPMGARKFIIETSTQGALGAPLSPDLPMCARCAEEIRNHANRRYRHFFNSCTACGPRFSLMKSLPYDRAGTSMAEFPLCARCGEEYRAPDSRRFHAETVCCHDCGPTLLYKSRPDATLSAAPLSAVAPAVPLSAAPVPAPADPLTGEAAFAAAADALRNGGVVMIKGVGGYHLACSPFDKTAVARLRRMKGREHKPFAVMFRDISQAGLFCAADDDERALLQSPARPIVPLALKNPGDSAAAFAPDVLRGDLRCGCFLPYTPLHLLLLDEISPLIMTSANLTGSAIIYQDADALRFLESHETLSGVLTHNRAIVRPVEDSVAAVTADGEAQTIRMARGYAPLTLPMDNPSNRQLLATGGDLKAAFCLVKDGYAHISQYFGDLMDADAYRAYEQEIDAHKALFGVEPTILVADMHPGYLSSTYANAYAEEQHLPVYSVQHHHAHVAAVIAEHGLTDKPVIGVAFDGAGYGADGAVWGGEWFVCHGADAKRAAHLDYVTLVGGDAAEKDAAKTAGCYLAQSGIDGFDNAALVQAAIKRRVNTARTSSMGRLFDAVAAILGIAQYNTYEGECAVRLQQAAERALEEGIQPTPLSFDIEKQDGMMRIKHDAVIRAAYACARACASAEAAGPETTATINAFALGFHEAAAALVCDMADSLCKETGAAAVALSGGVFVNGLLTARCRALLQTAGYRVYTGGRLPPGDGGIAFGQAYVALHGGTLS